MNNKLDQLALKYGTDKNMGHHEFTEKYERHFEHLRNKELTILEIGVKRGASVKMWKEYFPNSIIHGIDIDPKCKRYADDRIKIHIGDQNDTGFIKSISDKFDIIIDDGSHKWKDQINTFEALFPLITKGGIYIIEDLHTSFGKESIYSNHNITCMDYLHRLADKLTLSRNRHNPKVPFTAIHFYKAIAFIDK